MPSLQLINCWTCLIIKRWKYNPHERCCSPGWSVCVCVRACVRAWRALKLTCKLHWASGASKRSNTHTICKNGRLGDYSLKHSLCLKVNEKSWEKIVCVNILSSWHIGASSMLIKENITHSSHGILMCVCIYIYIKQKVPIRIPLKYRIDKQYR